MNAIRANTAYPTYRGIIGIIGGIALMSQYGFAGFILLLIGVAFGALTYFLAKFWKEAALIVADIGDSAMDANANAHSPVAPPMTPLATPAMTPPAYQG